jgi:putative SOS response-associated peptidase YedK
MCSQFTQRFPRHNLLETLKIIKDSGVLFDKKIMPYQTAYVIKAENEGLVSENMNFSLVPGWAKEPRVKFATHNARLETISEKPTFKGAFVKRHCVIPMNSFIEPIYLNEHAGNMVAFSSREIMYAAGIWEEWVDQKGGEVLSSFAIITSDPIPFVENVGHDRSPVFIPESLVETWLRSEGEKPEQLTDFLERNKFHPSFFTEIDRPMAKGWDQGRVRWAWSSKHPVGYDKQGDEEPLR